jgi:hypothetical protein
MHRSASGRAPDSRLSSQRGKSAPEKVTRTFQRMSVFDRVGARYLSVFSEALKFSPPETVLFSIDSDRAPDGRLQRSATRKLE